MRLTKSKGKLWLTLSFRFPNEVLNRSLVILLSTRRIFSYEVRGEGAGDLSELLEAF